jgi:hypothetical protein
MKLTAMQKLKQKLLLVSLMNEKFEPVLQVIIEDLDKQFIPLEKEEMFNAYSYGMGESYQWDAISKMFEEHYKETYNK